MKSWKDDPRAATNPLFNDNKLQLGLFGLNAGYNILYKAPDRYLANWDRCDAAIGRASELCIEAAVSVMGWQGPPELEPFTWAAGLGARHPNPAVIATMHMQLNHPVFVAKASATVDCITHGRFALKPLICGSIDPADMRALPRAAGTSGGSARWCLTTTSLGGRASNASWRHRGAPS